MIFTFTRSPQVAHVHDFPASIGIDFQMAEMKREQQQQQQQHKRHQQQLYNEFTHSIKIQETKRQRERGSENEGGDRARDDEVTEAITHLGRPPRSQYSSNESET